MRYIYKFTIFTFSILNLVVLRPKAQSTTDVFTVASTAGPGLSDIRIIDLARFGPKLWIATDGGGVNTFDGTNWEVITQEDGLPNDRITTILFDADGTPWIGTRGSGVVKMEENNWQIFKTADGLTHGWISCSMQANDGSLWFGTRSGISVYDGGNWTTFTTEDGILADYIADIFQDATGDVWVATGQGVNRYDGNQWTAYTIAEGLTKNNTVSISQDKNGAIWVGTWGGGVSVLTNGNWSNLLENNFVRKIARDNNGDMYVAALYGMYKYDYNDFDLMSFEEKDDLHGYGNVITDIIIDNNQSIFAGTWNGLILSNSQGSTRFNADVGLCSNSIININEDKAGHIWMASSDRGLSIYDREDWEVHNYINTFEGERIYDVFRDSKDDMWVATSAGAYRYAEGQWQRLTTDDGLLHNVTYSIFEDSKGRLWFGTFGGLTMIDGKEVTQLTVNDGLINNEVYHILEDANRHFWFGTNSGLSFYDGSVFTSFTQGLEIPADQINDLAMDANKNVWVGTSSGVSKFDGSQWEILQMPEISNNSVYTIMPEENGSVWIGTFNGINRYLDGNITKYFSNDGTLYQNSVQTLFKASGSEVWAATFSDGVFVMDFTTSTHSDNWGAPFQIYPNPVKDHLTLDVNAPVRKVQIVNSMGAEILKKNIDRQARFNLNIPSVPPGLYHLMLEYSDGKMAVDKFIKVE